MKITRINVESVLGLPALDIALRRPVMVATAGNGQGKTSLANCLGMALNHGLARVSTQKEVAGIIHNGAKSGLIEVFSDRYDAPFTVHITPGKVAWKNPAGEEGPEFIEFVLNPSRFASLDVSERRSTLYRLLGLDLQPEAIKARLIARECDEAKVDAIAPILRAGFDAACKHAASKATESKGAFRAVTQETWGSTKGATWRAPTPPFSGEEAAELQGIDQSIASAEVELAEANRRLGGADHAARVAQQRERDIEHLKAIAAKLDEHLRLVQKFTPEVKELEDELQEAKQKAGVAPAPKPRLLPCPDCGAALCLQPDGSLAAYPTLPEDPPRDADAAASIPSIQKALDVQRTVLARHIKNRDDAQTAALNLEMLEKSDQAKPIDPQPIRDTIATLQTSIATMRKRQAGLQAAQRLLDVADEKTKAARGHHADVLTWDAIAKALSPDGIPAEILKEALGPFNARLEISAADTGWPLVVLGDDMSITYGGRSIALCSESERYRADAMIGEAISSLSGLRVLLLDRADLLDATGWDQLMHWADVLAYEKDVDTLLILATKNEPPTGLTDLMDCVRIEDGRIVPIEQREAA